MAELTGIDIAWDRPTVAQIKAVGAHWVARYFSTDDNKDLHPSEVTAYKDAGLAIVTVFETTAGRATAGFAAGAADARNAEAQRKAVGLPDAHIHHFAVDKDVSWAAVAPYFDGVISVIGLPRTGCYGGIDVINGAYLRGIRYLWQTVAWSEGRWNPHATIRQTGGTTLSGGADWDTAETPDFGQYPRPISPEDDMTPEQATQLQQLHDVLVPYAGWGYKNADQAKKTPGMPDAYGYLTQTHTMVKAQSAAITALAAQLGKDVDTATVVTAVQKAIADAVVHVAVDVTGPTA